MKEEAEVLFWEFRDNIKTMSIYGCAKVWKGIEVDLQYRRGGVS